MISEKKHWTDLGEWRDETSIDPSGPTSTVYPFSYLIELLSTDLPKTVAVSGIILPRVRFIYDLSTGLI